MEYGVETSFANNNLLSSFENRTGRNHPLASNLRKLRKSAGFTQEDLAFEIEMSREWISQIENGYAHAIDSLKIDTVSTWCFVCFDQTPSSKLCSYAKELIYSISEYYKKRVEITTIRH